jgi:hypothetical protein
MTSKPFFPTPSYKEASVTHREVSERETDALRHHGHRIFPMASCDPRLSEGDQLPHAPRRPRHNRDTAFNGITDGLIGTTEDIPLKDESRRL